MPYCGTFTDMNRQLIEKWVQQHDPQGMAKLSGASEISEASIRRIISGKTHSPGLEILRKIAAGMGVSISTLIGEEDQPVIKQA